MNPLPTTRSLTDQSTMEPMPQRRRAALALAIAAALPLAACVTGERAAPEGSNAAWSTRGQSTTTAAGTPSMSLTVDAPREGVLARPAPRAVAAGPVDPQATRAAAIEVIRTASGSSSALLRAHAIEALASAPKELDSIVGRGLVDENRGVRFVAAMSIARSKRRELVHLVEPLLTDDSLSVRAAALAALATCGRRPDLTPLASMIRSDDPEVRANAYLALGVIGQEHGGASAIPMVRESVGQGLPLADTARVKVIELQAAECLVRLGRSEEIEPIRAALFAPAEQAEVTALACQMIGRLKDGRSRPMLERLVEADGTSARPNEIRLIALEALARLGVDPTRILPVASSFIAARQPAQRAQAALAIGASGDASALGFVAPLLEDPDPIVRLAAASAILESTSTAR
jgi:HEAT repeat protein